MPADADEPTPDRRLHLTGLPAAVDAPYGGGASFFAYCMGAGTRAEQRRIGINRAYGDHRRALQRGEDPYPTALLVAQRAGVALEDLARLAVAFSVLGDGDPFESLRSARILDLDEAYERLAEDPEILRSTFRLPSPEDTADVDEPLRSSLLELSDALAARWVGHWARAAGGWQLVRRLAKGMRHGSPMLPRELVLGPPGAGTLGRGLVDVFDRWVLVMETDVDNEAASITTSYAAADVTDATLAQVRQAALDAVALAREVANSQVQRVQTESKWAFPPDALRLVGPAHRRLLKEHRR